MSAFLLLLILAAEPVRVPLDRLCCEDVAGTLLHLQSDDKPKVIVFVFLSTECPIATSYIPRLNAMQSEGVKFYGIVSDPELKRADAITFHKEYALKFPLLFDDQLELAKTFQPTHVPEAFVVNREGEILYRGRIDDQFVAIGKPRVKPQSHDLLNAIKAIQSGKKPDPARTTPVGCLFEAKLK